MGANLGASVALVVALLSPGGVTPASAAEDAPVLPLRAEECVTIERLDGTWTPVACYAPHAASVPDGTFRSIVHTHPRGSSLSLADLQLLARADQVVAITATQRFVARRGPTYAGLEQAYTQAWTRVFSGAPASAPNLAKALHRINQQLAAHGVIVYVVEEK